MNSQLQTSLDASIASVKTGSGHINPAGWLSVLESIMNAADVLDARLATVNTKLTNIHAAFTGLTVNITNIDENGGVLAYKRTAVTGNYTALAADFYLGVSTLSASLTITLPTASGAEGKMYIVKDETGQCSALKTITVVGTSGQTIDGGANVVMILARGSIGVISDGANWHKVYNLI